MRHRVDGYKLGRLTQHRWALFRNLLTGLFRHERIETTEAKAKAVRGLADHVITLAKRENLHARRQVLSLVPDTEAAGSGEDYLREALGKSLEELPLPQRAVNALHNADLSLVADLAQKTEADLELVKNLGDKSIEEIKTALASLGLSLGMRIDPAVLGALNRSGTR